MPVAVHKPSNPLGELHRFFRVGSGPNRLDNRLHPRREPIVVPNDGVSHTASLPFTIPLLTLPSSNTETLTKPTLTGEGNAISALRELLKKVARLDINVLITGETGTGKELAAKMLYKNSFRNLGPFKAVNCSAIPKQLLESVLFGHIKGSFTGASETTQGLFVVANNGTLFLDEIGELDEQFLWKLIRVIKTGKLRPVGSNNEKEVNVRVIAATNKDLSKVVRDPDLLRSLYNVVQGFPISTPPLREHKEDIADIASSLLYRNSKIVPGKLIAGFSPEAIEILNKHDWPGNVRELENVIKRAMVLSPDGIIQESDIVISKFIPPEKQAECIADIAASEATVFIYGEPGSEIEQIAWDIHSLSERREHSFVPVDCASIPISLAESDFFGHAKGAFTDAKIERIGHFESANDGTLVLLGVDKLPLELQSMLLRTLQEGQIMRVGETSERPVNPRIISTATSDLEKLVKEGKFREDLYNRLIVIPLRVPPLRENHEDIELSAREFLQELNGKGGKNILDFSPEAIRKLKQYKWPGNLDELKNVVSRAFILADDGEEIQAKDILLDNVTQRKNDHLSFYKDQILEFIAKEKFTRLDIEKIAVSCCITNQSQKSNPRISEAALAEKFNTYRTTTHKKITHQWKYKSLEDFRINFFNKLDLVNQNEVQTHPIINKYVDKFLELATNNEPISFGKFHAIILKCLLLNELIKSSEPTLSNTSNQMDMSRNTLREQLRENGYENLEALVAELRVELGK